MACNICLDQLLEPDPVEELVVLNNQGSPSLFERGTLALANGVSSATVVFTTQKMTNGYTFNELSIENLTDGDPLQIFAAISRRSQAGFSVTLTGATDSENYRLKWEVNVVEI